MAGMHADLIFITGLINLAIALNVIVVADALIMEAGIMTGSKHIDSKALVAASGTAMANDKINFSTHTFTS